MRSLRKQVNSLSSSSRKKLEWIMAEVSRGVGYRELSGHKLHTPKSKVDWISFPLKYRERAIMAINKAGEYYLYSATSHETYNRIVGPKVRKRLISPWG